MCPRGQGRPRGLHLWHVYSITVQVPALPVVSVSKLSPELSLIVSATGKETCASLSIIISCHLSRRIGSKMSYLLGYYCISMALGFSIA